MDFEIELGKALNKLEELLADRNESYGNSLFESMDEFGLFSALVRMQDKLNRLKAIGDDTEGAKDTLADLAGYAVMALIWIEWGSKFVY
jgi:hypothetical protein